ncbi:DEAD/DEAH box helicase [Clostridium aciditolerans]|uniref:DEAD/DEAH box helicase n=1 Tax=Clostridium aciditolerans TaxID=339861 RepID=A0A934HTI0_9CLOT|nr:DEAD/DEAH box helicase [Clostridium aciditolerans]MBI6871609.1 DEAD/DEAH box helicase [Clostridium aciditolerans]
MNFNELEQIIFKTSSNLMRKSGEKIFRDGLVSNIKGKKIDNIYHIYGDVLNNLNHNKYKTYIKINLSNKKLDSVSCTCEDFKEISINKNLFMCEHLTATGYKFLSILHKKKGKEDNSFKKLPEDKKTKVEVGIDVKITCKSWKDETNYELEFRLGRDHKYLITDLKNFISSLNKGETIFFNNQFTYNPSQYTICTNDIKVIDFIKEYVSSNRGISDTGRNLIIQPEDLRAFLECVGGNKILFKYNGIEYKVDILKRDLPVSFTLKEKNEHFVLTTHKKLPIPLNRNKDVYFFNGQLYLPSKNQIEIYSPLYDKFQKEGEILYNKTIKNYNAIISIISSISNNIIIGEDVKRFGVNSLRFEFLIYKEESNIYCEVYAIYYNEKVNILKSSSNKTDFIRDYNKEEKALMKLEYYKFIKRKDKLIFIGEDDDIFNLLSTRESSIRSLGNVMLGKGMEDVKIFDSSFIEIDLYEENGYLRFNYNIGDIDKTELSNIYESYKSNNRFYKTKDNRFIDFEDDGIIGFFNLIEILDTDKNIEKDSIKIEKSKALYIWESLNNKNYKLGKGINLIKDIEKKLTEINAREIALPKNLKAILREYQISGFKWFKNLSELEFGGILADEMGLGKTVQTIAFLTSEENKKSLIITPTSLIYNWKDEMDRFASRLKVGIAHGSIKEQEKVLDKLEEYEVILTTYGTLRNNIKKYSNIQFDYCIIDEAQNIKNPITQSTRAIKEIKAKVKFALTGTPIENNLTELWSIFDFIMPGYLYSRETFDEKFISDCGCDLDNLKLLIKPFILRRTKKEVIKDLPDKIEKKILVEMPAAQKAIYGSYIKEVRGKIKNNSDGKIEVFSYLTKLRQICLDPSLIVDEYKGGSGKLKVAMSLIEEQIASGGKLLLFSQFTSALKKIGRSLNEKGIQYFYLDGSTGSKERIRLVNEFNNSDNIKVFLISLKAGGTGLNLTSASLVIHFDPWWNPAVENQATDRAHRIGQRNVVEVVKLVARGTIEEKIILLQEHKKELIDNIITGELKNSDIINKLSKEELMKLFDRE